MAGVLFIIWIPCQEYEQVLSNRRITTPKLPRDGLSSSEDETDNLKVSIARISSTRVHVGIHQGTQESKQGSVATRATSIESDSLNPVDEEVGTDKEKKQLLRTKSADNLIGDATVKPITNASDASAAPDDCSQEMRGSTDSGLHRRMENQRALVRENEEACRRFFDDDQDGVLKIDEKSSMEEVMREIIEMMRIRFLIIFLQNCSICLFLFYPETLHGFATTATHSK